MTDICKCKGIKIAPLERILLPIHRTITMTIGSPISWKYRMTMRMTSVIITLSEKIGQKVKVKIDKKSD
jgi:hypothetical protein